jgi:hypothetical protein
VRLHVACKYAFYNTRQNTVLSTEAVPHPVGRPLIYWTHSTSSPRGRLCLAGAYSPCAVDFPVGPHPTRTASRPRYPLARQPAQRAPLPQKTPAPALLTVTHLPTSLISPSPSSAFSTPSATVVSISIQMANSDGPTRIDRSVKPYSTSLRPGIRSMERSFSIFIGFIELYPSVPTRVRTQGGDARERGAAEELLPERGRRNSGGGPDQRAGALDGEVREGGDRIEA